MYYVLDVSFETNWLTFKDRDPAVVAQWLIDNNRYPAVKTHIHDGFWVSRNEDFHFGSAGLINRFVEHFVPDALKIRDERVKARFADLGPLGQELAKEAIKALDEMRERATRRFEEEFPPAQVIEVIPVAVSLVRPKKTESEFSL